MGSLVDSLNAQIAAIDAQMAKVTFASVGDASTNVTNVNWIELSKRRMHLEALLGRATGTSPMIVRGRVKGLTHGRV